MTLAIIDRAIQKLALPCLLPEQLSGALQGLDVAERAIQELGFLDSLDPPPHWAQVQEHVTRAHAALTNAPSVHRPSAAPPPTLHLALDDLVTVTDALIRLAEALVLVLIEAAGRAHNAEDEAACLEAALHGNDLHHALHRSRNAHHTRHEPHQLPADYPTLINDD
ncbi:hypothetical protein [Spirillospora sp. CA-294931]|uniref:hypothetical protein n=1 Tax=Spirillospora sp. CA-294931 TaxID=3240042 RepID=UPI003D8DDD73